MLNEKIRNLLSDAGSIFALIGLVGSLRKAQTVTGRSSYVVTGKGQEVKTVFKVVDARHLIISNNLDGTINPLFPAELQPRDRTRLTSKVQVSKIAGNLRPAKLTDSGMSSHGAPIVGADNVVESGNGRSMGITRAYEQGQADEYRQYLIDHAKDYGLKASDIAQMDMPVLVRERVTDVDRAQFAKDSNLSDLQEMAASEKAFVDAEMLDERLMAIFNPSDDGNLLARSNDGFIRAFMKEIGDTATAGLLTEDGRPTKQLIDRMQNAIFARAYKDERLVKLVSEEPDPEMRNILTALNTAASEFAQMQMLSGDVHRQAVTGLVDGVQSVDGLDQQAIAALQDAIKLVRQAKDSGQAIQEVLAQQGLFEESSKEAEALALFIVANNRSAKRIGAAFKKMAQKINDELLHQQQALGDMFGGGELTLTDVLTAVSGEIEEEFGEGKGMNFAMFESAGMGLPKRQKLAERIVAGAKSVNELVDVVYGFPAHTPGAVPVAAIMASINRLMKTAPDNTAALATYQDLNASLMGKNIKEIKQQYALDSVYALLRQAGMPSVTSQADWSLVFNQGELLQYASMLQAFVKTTEITEKAPLARQIFPAYYRRLKGKRVFPDGIMGIMRLSGVSNIAGVYSSLMECASYKPPATLTPDEAGRLAISSVATGAAIMADLGLSAGSPEDVKARTEVLKSASEKFEALDEEADYSSFLGKLFSNMRFAPGTLNAVARGDRPLRDTFSADDLAMLEKVQALDPELADTIRSTVHLPVSTAKQRLDEHVQGLISGSRITQADADAWADSIEIHKDAEKSFDGRFGKGTLQRNLSDLYRLTGGKLKTLKRITFKQRGRASASLANGAIQLSDHNDLSVLWHEAGHHYEYNSADLMEQSKAFLRHRQRSETLNTWAYKKGQQEQGIDGGFSSAYIGRLYGNGTIDNTTATEIISMGFQMLADARLMADSVSSGDEVMDFVLGQLQKEHN